MRDARAGFAGWAGGARGVAPELFRKRDAQVHRQFELILRALTPHTVFMEIGAADCELALRAAGYVERVWCVDAAAAPARPPCNLRCAPIGSVPVESIDVAFSEGMENAEYVCRVLKPGGVWFIYGKLVQAAALRGARFSRVQYYGANLPLPRALARLSRAASTAAFK
jgi:hypothetical protein